MKTRFREMRKSLHLTQEEIGALMGISGATVSQIESGRSRPTDAALKLICSTYHVNYLWITEGIGPMMEALDTDDLVDKYLAGESEITRSIMKAFARLPDSEWEKLKALIDRIKKEGT